MQVIALHFQLLFLKKTVKLARSKLNSIERKTSKALINTEISHKDFMAIKNEENKY